MRAPVRSQRLMILMLGVAAAAAWAAQGDGQIIAGRVEVVEGDVWPGEAGVGAPYAPGMPLIAGARLNASAGRIKFQGPGGAWARLERTPPTTFRPIEGGGMHLLAGPVTLEVSPGCGAGMATNGDSRPGGGLSLSSKGDGCVLRAQVYYARVMIPPGARASVALDMDWNVSQCSPKLAWSRS